MGTMCYHLSGIQSLQRVRELKNDEFCRENSAEDSHALLNSWFGGNDRDGGFRITDGSHGLIFHKDEGENPVRHGVCMPSPCALGCSFDRELVREVGKAVGSLAAAGGYNALLSPDAGVVRSPLYGSLADRFGEDPYLCGELAAEWVSGVQSEGVAAVLNRFAGGTQATGKFTCDNMIDRRALHEIYLTPFEKAVRQSSPRAVLCGIDRLNGVPVCENHVLLTDILRRQWKFEGAVLADLRVSDPAVAMESGVDFSFPAGNRRVRRALKKALREGRIPARYPEASAGRIRAAVSFPEEEIAGPLREEECRELAIKAAEGSAVLLKNHKGTLPLPLGGSFALIGRPAKFMRVQRGGIGALEIDPPRHMLNVFDDNQIRYKYCEGFGEDSLPDSGLLAEAVRCASESEFAVVFVGFDDAYDNAVSDRFTNQLPKAQTKLISAVAKVNPNTVVVVGGSALPKMNWIGRVKAVLYLPLGGEGTADALYNLLFGFADPCGRLPVSYSLNESELSCGDTFGVDPVLSQHRESIYVGYRYYGKAGLFAAFPFGYGLSYTKFEYSRMRVTPCAEGWEVTVDVKNVGMRDGSEIVQFYAEPPKGDKFRPVRELKQFRKVFLPRGEKRTVSAVITRDSLACYSAEFGRTRVIGGRYRLCAAASSVDIRAEVWIGVKGEPVPKHAVPNWYLKPLGRPTEADFLELFGEPTSRHRLPTDPAFSTDSTLNELCAIGIFRTAVKLIRFIGDRLIKAPNRRDPAYAERMDGVLNMPVSRLSGLCGGWFPMKLTRMIIAIANRRRRRFK